MSQYLKKNFMFDTENLPKWTSWLLIGILIAYYVITLVNTNRIVEQVEMIGNHPYPIAIEVGKVNAGLSLLRTLPERLFYTRTPGVIEAIRGHYRDIDASFIKSFDFMASRYLTAPGEVLRMKRIYLELRDDQKRLLALCGDPAFTSEQARAFYAENIVPKVDEMSRITGDMSANSMRKFHLFHRLSLDIRRNTIILSTILTLAVFISLFIYRQLLEAKRRQEREMRDALKEALRSAQNANAAKSQFLFNISHDIRTPMNAIIGMTAIATTHIDEPAKVMNCLGKITASSKHLLSLINDVLDMSKIENGKMGLNEDEFVLPELIHGFITIAQPQAKSKRLEFDVSVAGIEHERVISDSLRINQILLNIIGNAVKFTPEGGTVRLDIRELPPRYKGYGIYQFTISDTGIGIPRDFIGKIFDPFERAKTSTNSRIEGTGLGMAITKNIVEMMGGQIAVASEPGKGTVFTVTLPLKLPERDAELLDLSLLHELRSLVVDDDGDVCENTAKMLEEIGMKSEWVLTGAEAVSRVAEAHNKAQDYHSVIIDWKMPEMDGLETTRSIRSIVGEDIPIIILTAYDWTDIEEEARRAGVNAFLAKPIFKSRLYHIMHGLILGAHETAETAPETGDALLDGRVLMVEDNELNMEIAVEFLQNLGVTVDKAVDGCEAVSMVKNTPKGYYKLIFMDIQMPRMDGNEAAAEIRRFEKAEGRPRTPITAMSANAFAEDMNKAYASGMDGYLTKPINIDDIRKMLKKYYVRPVKIFSILTEDTDAN
ncbi:response regulator [Cloacibacillus sp.]|nr:response regulator [Cloacibacillus sp.]